MTGSRAQTPADAADHPLRVALARGDRAHARSAPALRHLLAAPDQSLIEEAVVAQVRGMLANLASQLVEARLRSRPVDAATQDAMLARLLLEDDLRAHCQALALEWRLARKLESGLAIDPVLSPLLQAWVAEADAATGSLAMAALAAQARFAQAQRRMQLPLAELPAELFHAVLAAAREVIPDTDADAVAQADARLRGDYEEGASRLALLARLVREAGAQTPRALSVEDAGVALWLSALAARSGESRDRTACAAADLHLGRLLLTLRAAGAMPAEAERQALRIQPDADLPRGLADVGTREAAQWLADVQR
jgi:hypothetical protein